MTIHDQHKLDGRDIEKLILDAVEHIRYGSVEILIHDSRIVQIEKSEKIRFDGKKHAVSAV